MSATTTPEVGEILDRAMKLPKTDRAVIGRVLLDSVYPPPNAYDSEEALRAELQRRLEAIERGEMKMYTLEETLEHIQQALDAGKKP